MAGLGSVAWPLGSLAVVAAGYLLFVRTGLAPWFSAILVGSALLLLVGFSMTVSSTRDDESPVEPAGRPGKAAGDRGGQQRPPGR